MSRSSRDTFRFVALVAQSALVPALCRGNSTPVAAYLMCPISPKIINKRIVLLGYCGQAPGPRGAPRKPRLGELS